jgi:hypothetical protein
MLAVISPNDARLSDAVEDRAQGAGCQENGSDREYQLFGVHLSNLFRNPTAGYSESRIGTEGRRTGSTFE